MNEQYPWPQSAYNQIGEKDEGKRHLLLNIISVIIDITGDNGNFSSNANPGISKDFLRGMMDKHWRLKSWGRVGTSRGDGASKGKGVCLLCRDSPIRQLATGVQSSCLLTDATDKDMQRGQRIFLFLVNSRRPDCFHLIFSVNIHYINNLLSMRQGINYSLFELLPLCPFFCR